ncbi:MAG: HIT domain-containing protein [Mycoplasmatales bacterium]|nr:HIT domain-containing protein [Mycoplasmatales bacterium]
MDIFCKIIKKELSSEVIFENDNFIAFNDVNPATKGHFLVVPKLHSENLIDIDEKTYEELMKLAKKLALSRIKELNVSGFRVHVNNGKYAKQEVFHTHVHIIPSVK